MDKIDEYQPKNIGCPALHNIFVTARKGDGYMPKRHPHGERRDQIPEAPMVRIIAHDKIFPVQIKTLPTRGIFFVYPKSNDAYIAPTSL